MRPLSSGPDSPALRASAAHEGVTDQGGPVDMRQHTLDQPELRGRIAARAERVGGTPDDAHAVRSSKRAVKPFRLPRPRRPSLQAGDVFSSSSV